jgi:hypothetical protein
MKKIALLFALLASTALAQQNLPSINGTQYASLGAAVTFANNNAIPPATILVPAGYSETVTSTITISSPMTIQCQNGAVLTLGANVTMFVTTSSYVTISGCTLLQNSQQSLLVHASASSTIKDLTLSSNTIICGAANTSNCIVAKNTSGFSFTNNTVVGDWWGTTSSNNSVLLLSNLTVGSPGFLIENNNATIIGSASSGEVRAFEWLYTSCSGGNCSNFSSTNPGGTVSMNTVNLSIHPDSSGSSGSGDCMSGGGWEDVWVWGQNDVYEGNTCNVVSSGAITAGQAFFCYSFVLEYGATIQNNSCYANGSLLTAGYEVPFSHSNLIQGNTCNQCNAAAAGIELDDDPRDNIVTGNTIQGFSHAGIYLQGSSEVNGIPAQIVYNQVSGNTIQFSADTSNLAGIELGGFGMPKTPGEGTNLGEYNCISNNLIYGYSTQANTLGVYILVDGQQATFTNLFLYDNIYQDLYSAYFYDDYAVDGSHNDSDNACNVTATAGPAPPGTVCTDDEQFVNVSRTNSSASGSQIQPFTPQSYPTGYVFACPVDPAPLYPYDNSL